MTEQLPMPATMMKGALHVVPAPLQQPGLRWIVHRLRAEHPALFRRLCRLAPASILFEPDDTPHRFLLTITAHDLRLTLAHGAPSAAVRIKGRLAMLLSLLEGRIDSDTLYLLARRVVQRRYGGGGGVPQHAGRRGDQPAR